MTAESEIQETGRRLSYKFRLYPTPKQEEFFLLNFEACAHVYNHFLERRVQTYRASLEDPSVRPLTLFATTRELTRFKRESLRGGRPWLKDADSAALVYALRHLDAAFANFFKRVRAGGGQSGFPRPKKAPSSKRSYTTNRCQADAEGGFVALPKVGPVKARVHRDVEGEVLSATVTLDTAGRWHVSINVKDAPRHELPPADSAVGVFVGLDPWVATSDGEVFFASEELTSLERRMDREVRKLRKRTRGSANFAKQEERVARLAAQISDKRAHEAHVLTRRLVDEYGLIVARDVDARLWPPADEEEPDLRPSSKGGLLKLKRAVANASFGEVHRQLAYKADWAGRTFVLLPAEGAGPEAFAPAALAGPERIEAACKEAVQILEEGLESIRQESEGRLEE